MMFWGFFAEIFVISDCWKVALMWLPPRRKKLPKNRGVWGASRPTHPYFSKVFCKVLSKIYLNRTSRFMKFVEMKSLLCPKEGVFKPD